MAKKNQAQQFFTDKASMAREERFLAQCFLMQNIDRLLKDKLLNNKECYRNFISVNGDPSSFLGRIMRKSQQELFLQGIKPHQLSALVPKVRIYKVQYDPVNSKSYNQSEFFFDTSLNKFDVDSITQSNTRRSTGVGLKSCSWEFIGSNPAEAKRLIKVNLKVFFASMQDITKVSVTGLSFLDLIKPVSKNNKSELDPKYHQVKIEIGWACPPESHVLFQGQEELLAAIKNASLSMFLSLTTHDLQFKQDGRVLLNANFWGRLESNFEANSDTRFDILEIKNRNQVLIQKNSYKLTEKEIQARTKLLDCIAKDAQRRGDRNALRRVKREIDKVTKQNLKNIKERKSLLVSEKKVKYEKIISELLKQNKVYYLSVDQNALGALDDKTIKRTIGSGRTVGKCSSAQIKTQHDLFVNNFRNLSKLTTTNKGELSNKKLLDSRLPKFDSCVLVHYFYFGDLLDIILDGFYKLDTGKDKEYFTRFLLGSITNPLDPKKKINLANIPISIQLFSVWFSKKVISRSRDTYPFNEFIRDIMTGLIQPIMNDRCLQTSLDSNDKKKQTQIRPRISLFQLEGRGKDGRVDPILDLAQKNKNTRIPNTNNSNLNKCDNVITSNDLTTVRIGSKNNNSNYCGQTNQNPLFDYMFIYTTEESADYRVANYAKDQEDGIYHFFVGADRGIVREVNFKQNSQPYLKEAIMQGTGLEWLKRLYDANIKMYGASFVPGQKVFINPTTVGLGEPNAPNSIASQMGLGGYYVIIKVFGHIEAGKFDTELVCKWESRGDGFGYKSETSNLDNCIEEYKKVVGTRSGRFFQSPENIKKLFRSPAVVRKAPLPNEITQGQNNQSQTTFDQNGISSGASLQGNLQ